MGVEVVSIMTALIGVLGSFVVAYFTSKKEMAKSLLVRREEVYLELIPLLDEVQENAALTFDLEFAERLGALVPRMRLHGSAALSDVLREFHQAICNAARKHESGIKYCDSEEVNELENLEMEFLGNPPCDREMEIKARYRGLREWEDGSCLMAPDDLERFVCFMTVEMCRSLGNKEFRPLASLRKRFKGRNLSLWC